MKKKLRVSDRSLFLSKLRKTKGVLHVKDYSKNHISHKDLADFIVEVDSYSLLDKFEKKYKNSEFKLEFKYFPVVTKLTIKTSKIEYIVEVKNFWNKGYQADCNPYWEHWSSVIVGEDNIKLEKEALELILKIQEEYHEKVKDPKEWDPQDRDDEGNLIDYTGPLPFRTESRIRKVVTIKEDSTVGETKITE